MYDQPNGQCSHCGAPLNEHMVGGYKLHDGTFATPAKVSNKWNELKEWVKEQIKEEEADILMHTMYYRFILNKMKVIDDEEYSKLLAEAGY